MRNPAKAILVAILIAIPAPFVLGLLLTTTPEPLKILAMGQGLEALGSQGGVAAYLFAFVVIAVAAFLAITLASIQSASHGSNARKAPRAPNPSNQYDDEEDDFDDSTPEGDEEGTVKWFNVKKGFGFIVRDSGDEIFVHFRAIRGRGRRVLRQGQLVRFDVVEADKGLQADNVSILSD
ncbi:cold-shock protein [Marinobacter daepoensis]|uniref:cold-shock protein n=1 Tax=Marinobacter daepoensis TaxID=262077 RepID=UPI0023EC3659|nr:cold shock domain-containing protein [Marinobacter daepoensis]